MANLDRGEHGFQDYATAQARADSLQSQDGRERKVINLGFFSGLSVIPVDLLNVMSKKAA